MKPSKQAEVKEQQIPAPIICTVPVLPRFQAELPLTISRAEYIERTSDSKRFVGIKIWPDDSESSEINYDLIGKGRIKSCSCEDPGSLECNKVHISSKRMQLQCDLGDAFWQWKFDDMGEEVSKLWSAEEQKKFHCIIRSNAKSFGRVFVNSASQHLPCQTRESILSYYWNVHVPRRMIRQRKIAGSRVDTDDELEGIVSPPKGSRKRMQGKFLMHS